MFLFGDLLLFWAPPNYYMCPAENRTSLVIIKVMSSGRYLLGNMAIYSLLSLCIAVTESCQILLWMDVKDIVIVDARGERYNVDYYCDSRRYGRHTWMNRE